MDLQVASRVEGDVSGVRPVTPYAKRDLLRHGAARHQHAGLRSQQVGHPPLQSADHFPGAVLVLSRVRVDVLDQRSQLLANRPNLMMRQAPGGLDLDLVGLWPNPGVTAHVRRPDRERNLASNRRPKRKA